MAYQKKPRISKIIANYANTPAAQEILFDISKKDLLDRISRIEHMISRHEETIELRSAAINDIDKTPFVNPSKDFAKNQIVSIFDLEITLITARAQYKVLLEVYNKYF